MDGQIRCNAGARYPISESLVVGGYFSYTDPGSAKIEGGFWSGKYNFNELYQFQVFANWVL